MRRRKRGRLSSCSGSRAWTANSGIRPTKERTRRGTKAPSGCMQDVVEEAILLIPQADALAAHVVEGVGDVDKVLKELGGHILVGRLGAGQLQGDGQHVQAVHGHPGGAVGLLDVAAGGQGRAAIKDADVVQPQKAALKDVVAVGILAVDPPGKVEQQLVKDPLQERRCRPGRWHRA